MNKKANIMEIVLSPPFMTVLALGLVGLTIFNAIVEVGTNKAYDEKIFSARNAMTRDALQAISKDTNAIIEIKIPEGMGLEIGQHQARAAFGAAGHTFYYTKSPDYLLLDAEFDPKKNNSPLAHYKIGNTIGTQSGFKPNLIIPYCEQKTKPMKIQYEKQEINNIGKIAVKLTSGEMTIYAKEGTGEPVVKIYTNSEDGQKIACYIIQNIAEKFPIKGGAPIPVNTQLIPDTDSRNLQSDQMLVEISLPINTPADKAKFATAIYDGVKKYAE
ncbi:MAG: hypothetical protein NTW67_06590 [Candidatus Woesearchaeota archaeon]|nr:hypothetical protein [Candidatus Woesearchaeota archaeon]